MGDVDGGKRTIQQGKVVENIPTMSKEKTHIKFKFSNIGSGMFRAATEFGKFSSIKGGEGWYDGEGVVHSSPDCPVLSSEATAGLGNDIQGGVMDRAETSAERVKEEWTSEDCEWRRDGE